MGTIQIETNVVNNFVRARRHGGYSRMHAPDGDRLWRTYRAIGTNVTSGRLYVLSGSLLEVFRGVSQLKCRLEVVLFSKSRQRGNTMPCGFWYLIHTAPPIRLLPTSSKVSGLLGRN